MKASNSAQHTLKFSLAPKDFSQVSCGLVILPVFSVGNAKATTVAGAENLQSWLQELVEVENFNCEIGSTLLITPPHQTTTDKPWKRVLLVGMGEESNLSNYLYSKALASIKSFLLATGSKDALILLANAKVKETSSLHTFSQTARVIQGYFYEYKHASRGKDFKPAKRNLIDIKFINLTQVSDEAVKQKIHEGACIGQGMMLTRDIANLPPNYCTPTELENTAKKLASSNHTKLRVLELDECREMGMGAFYSVAKGSTEPAKLIVLEYKHPQAKKSQSIALVGKGVTFDTGGISLKPGNAMDEMKFDMCGAATVLGSLHAIQKMELPLNVTCVIPATENMPAGNASKPGDVVVSLSGQTIEILNTDAEGRLILCDALTFVQKEYKPTEIIDIATLTGACIVALGHEKSAVLSNNSQLCKELIRSGVEMDDTAWELPLDPIYNNQLKSNFADMANIGGRAGTITAAEFLGRFIEKNTPWAHLDIAGTAWLTGNEKGATGRPVPLLVNYLLAKA